MYTELYFYVQKVFFFYDFREYFHKEKDKYFTMLWKFDEKNRKRHIGIGRKKRRWDKNDEKSKNKLHRARRLSQTITAADQS